MDVKPGHIDTEWVCQSTQSGKGQRIGSSKLCVQISIQIFTVRLEDLLLWRQYLTPSFATHPIYASF